MFGDKDCLALGTVLIWLHWRHKNWPGFHGLSSSVWLLLSALPSGLSAGWRGRKEEWLALLRQESWSALCISDTWTIGTKWDNFYNSRMMHWTLWIWSKMSARQYHKAAAFFMSDLKPSSRASVATILCRHWIHKVWEHGRSLGQCSPASNMPVNIVVKLCNALSTYRDTLSR